MGLKSLNLARSQKLDISHPRWAEQTYSLLISDSWHRLTHPKSYLGYHHQWCVMHETCVRDIDLKIYNIKKKVIQEATSSILDTKNIYYEM